MIKQSRNATERSPLKEKVSLKPSAPYNSTKNNFGGTLKGIMMQHALENKYQAPEFNFTDNDVDEIVKSGKIPTIKSLMEYADLKVRNVNFNSDHVGKTILTTTHILDSQTIQARIELPELQYDYNEPAMEDPLPSNILGTVAELRKALMNPGSYWRTSKEAMETRNSLDVGNNVLN